MADFVLSEITEKHRITGDSGTIDVSFCVTDPFFLERLEAAASKIDALREEQEKVTVNPGATGAEKYDAFTAFDKKVKAVIDEAFQAPVSETCFASNYMWGLYNDLPLWLNLILWALDKTFVAGDEAGERMAAKIKQYENKYTKKYHK